MGLLTLPLRFSEEGFHHVLLISGKGSKNDVGGFVGQEMVAVDLLVLGLAVSMTADLPLILGTPGLILRRSQKGACVE